MEIQMVASIKSCMDPPQHFPSFFSRGKTFGASWLLPWATNRVSSLTLLHSERSILHSFGLSECNRVKRKNFS